MRYNFILPFHNLLCPFGFILGLHILFVENNAFKCTAFVSNTLCQTVLETTHDLYNDLRSDVHNFFLPSALQNFSFWLKTFSLSYSPRGRILKLRYSYRLSVLCCSHHFFHGCDLSWTLSVERYCFLCRNWYVGLQILFEWTIHCSIFKLIPNSFIQITYCCMGQCSMEHFDLWLKLVVCDFGLKSKVTKHSTRLLYLLIPLVAQWWLC